MRIAVSRLNDLVHYKGVILRDFLKSLKIFDQLCDYLKKDLQNKELTASQLVFGYSVLGRYIISKMRELDQNLIPCEKLGLYKEEN
jgi:hypothetical protein